MWSQGNLLGNARLTSTRFGSLDNSMESLISTFSLDDGIWVDEDLEHNIIRYEI